MHRNNQVTKHALLGTRTRKERDDATTGPDRRPSSREDDLRTRIAIERDRAASIDVDDIRQLIIAELGRNR